MCASGAGSSAVKFLPILMLIDGYYGMICDNIWIILGGFLSHGGYIHMEVSIVIGVPPIAGWFAKILLEWMMTRGTPILGNLYISTYLCI